MTDPTPVRPRTAVLLALCSGVLSYALLRWWTDASRPFPSPSWLELVALTLIGAVVLVLSRRVRRMALGLPGPHVTALTAARTVVLAQAAAVSGAVVAGMHAAGALVLLPETASSWSGVVRTLVLALGGAAVCVIGFVGQRWCRRPDDPALDAG